jgi:hypothetical protein
MRHVTTDSRLALLVCYALFAPLHFAHVTGMESGPGLIHDGVRTLKGEIKGGQEIIFCILQSSLAHVC